MRWTKEEKISGLTIYKRSPKCYRFLRTILALPCIRTLQRLLGSSPFSVGIHENALASLVESLAEREPHNRLCLLLFDEMAIRQHLHYQEAKDVIIGFEDHGNLGRMNRPAKYALVFMVRGLLQDWKQPIAAFFSGSPTNAERLKEILELVLVQCHKSGLQVIGTVCDMGSNNVKTLKDMGSTQERPVINLHGQDFITVFDPPHLLKSTRNLLLRYDACFPVEVEVEDLSVKVPGTAKWQDIRDAYEWDRKHHEYRTLRRLSFIHIEPKGHSKLRVNVAAQVMSQAVSSYLMTGYSAGFLSSSAFSTSRFARLVDNMFDSLNGGIKADVDHRWKGPVTRSSGHLQFWGNAKNLVDCWEFLQNSVPGISDDERPAIRRPPTVTGWLTTLTATEMIWDKVNTKYNVKKFGTRRVNQDPLENFFGCIRAQCGSKKDPTASAFIDAWKTCIFSGLAIEGSIRMANCLKDGASLIGNFEELHEKEGDDSNTRSLDTSVATPEKDYSSLCRSTADFCRIIAADILVNSTCGDCRTGIYIGYKFTAQTAEEIEIIYACMYVIQFNQ